MDILISRRHWYAVLAVLIAGAAPARGDIVQTFYIPPEVTVPNTGGNIHVTATVNEFDPALGTLVQMRVNGTVGFDVIHPAGSSGSVTGTLTLNGEVVTFASGGVGGPIDSTGDIHANPTEILDPFELTDQHFIDVLTGTGTATFGFDVVSSTTGGTTLDLQTAPESRRYYVTYVYIPEPAAMAIICPTALLALRRSRGRVAANQ